MNGLTKTDFLTATSTFLIGIGSVCSAAGNYYQFNTPEDPDQVASAADWRIIGQDMQSAMGLDQDQERE